VRANPTPLPTRAAFAAVKDQTQHRLGQSGGTAYNAAAGALLHFGAGALAEDTLVAIQPLEEAPRARGAYVVLSKAVRVLARDAQDAAVARLSANVCFIYTAEQLAQAGGNVENLVILRNVGQADEAEVVLNRRVDEKARQVCAEEQHIATLALARRETQPPPDNRAALVQTALTGASLALASGAVALGAIALVLFRRKRV
jgi:hypothetical protein